MEEKLCWTGGCEDVATHSVVVRDSDGYVLTIDEIHRCETHATEAAAYVRRQRTLKYPEAVGVSMQLIPFEW